LVPSVVRPFEPAGDPIKGAFPPAEFISARNAAGLTAARLGTAGGAALHDDADPIAGKSPGDGKHSLRPGQRRPGERSVGLPGEIGDRVRAIIIPGIPDKVAAVQPALRDPDPNRPGAALHRDRAAADLPISVRRSLRLRRARWRRRRGTPPAG